MSYQEKYLKYKSKYLQLKALKKNLQQLGGKHNDTETEDKFMTVNNLTDTPTFVKPKNKSKKSRNSRNYSDSESNLFSSSTESSSITDSFELSPSDEDL
jgi:hypothetical protein